MSDYYVAPSMRIIKVRNGFLGLLGNTINDYTIGHDTLSGRCRFALMEEYRFSRSVRERDACKAIGDRLRYHFDRTRSAASVNGIDSRAVDRSIVFRGMVELFELLQQDIHEGYFDDFELEADDVFAA